MTKFSHSLALNSSPEWRDFYLSYSKLKKIAYILEKATLGTGNIPETVKELRGMADLMSPASAEAIDENEEIDGLEASPGDLETATLLPKMSLQDANEFFTSSLDAELLKLSLFYDRKYTEICGEVHAIIDLITSTETDQQNHYGGGPRPQYLPFLLWNTPSLLDSKLKFQTKLKECFIRLTDLHDYIEINETGFGKVLKKYEKVVGGVIRDEYLTKVLVSKGFTSQDRQALDTDRLVEFYARISNEVGKIFERSELPFREQPIPSLSRYWLRA
jgi:phosphate transporter